MIIVTGGAGFIGSNIIHELNQQGISDILVVDSLGSGEKVPNLSDLQVVDFLGKEDFLRRVEAGQSLGAVQGILHQGACSDTMITDGAYVLQNNFEFSKQLYQYCTNKQIRFVYASSASVYGAGSVFTESIDNEKPLNLYAYSKYLFDLYVRAHQSDSTNTVVGLRYFNVYGPREFHKQRMASVVLHFSRQLFDTGVVNLFDGSDGYGPGEQRRDFVHIEDVVKVNLHYLTGDPITGIFNVGTGHSRSYNDMARAVINAWRQHIGTENDSTEKKINYVPFPDALVGKYQSFTEADIRQLRASGYQAPMHDLEHGVRLYVDWLAANDFG